MTRSKSNTGGASKSAPAKNRTTKAAPTKARPAARTAAQPRTTARPRTRTRTAAKRTTQRARREAAPSLTPIRKPQSRSQIIATVAGDVGIEPRTVELVTRSLSQTLTRHLVRGGSGRVEIPYLGGALWRGKQAAQKARTMLSPLLGRNVQVPARRAQPVPRFRAHRGLREIVAGI